MYQPSLFLKLHWKAKHCISEKYSKYLFIYVSVLYISSQKYNIYIIQVAFERALSAAISGVLRLYSYSRIWFGYKRTFNRTRIQTTHECICIGNCFGGRKRTLILSAWDEAEKKGGTKKEWAQVRKGEGKERVFTVFLSLSKNTCGAKTLWTLHRRNSSVLR